MSRQWQKQILNPGLSDANACTYNQDTKMLHVSEREHINHSSCMTKEDADSDEEASWHQSQPYRR